MYEDQTHTNLDGIPGPLLLPAAQGYQPEFLPSDAVLLSEPEDVLQRIDLAFQQEDERSGSHGFSVGPGREIQQVRNICNFVLCSEVSS